MPLSTDVVAPKSIRTGPRGEYQSSALMRTRLLEAGIECLARYGYAGTTTTLIQHAAGVSRGALLHHFPTRADLMLAIAHHAHKLGEQRVEERLQAYPAGRERFLALIGTVWETMDEPREVALVEIMVGARGDPLLAERITSFVDDMHRIRTDQVWAMVADLGVTNRARLDAAVKLHLAAMHGLSIEYLVTRDRRAMQPALDLLTEYSAAVLETA